MNEPTSPDPTVDLPVSGDSVDASPPALPRVILRDLDSVDGSPFVGSSSKDMPKPSARLQLHGEIARGGMGAVLKGRDTDLGRDLAVKVLLETHQGKTDLLQRFVEEAQITGQLQHPGIAPVYELGRLPDNRPYFTMKLVKGKTLAALLAARKTPGEERSRFVGIFTQICQTLAYAHARGVIHRDLKPANVMVGAFGEVQVMDWGLAKVLPEHGDADSSKDRPPARADVSIIRTQRSDSADPSDSPHTQAGTMLGTPAYMAPEQARGDVQQIDERTDVFGLGAILCEILTGQPPYVGTGAEVQYQARTAKLDDAGARLDGCGADPELKSLARRCLAAEPLDRPRHAGAVAAEVTNYQHSVDERLRQAELARAVEEARAVEARATAVQERRAHRMTLALAGTVLLTMVLGVGGWLWVHGQHALRLAENNLAIREALDEAATLHDRARLAHGDSARSLTESARDQAQRAKTLIERGPADSAWSAQLQTLLAKWEAEAKRRELAMTQFNRGINLSKQGLRDRAVAAFHKAVDSDPTFAAPHHHLGNILRDEGRLDEAIEEYRKDAALDPNGDFTHYTLGMALKAKGDREGALAAFRRAWTLNPAGTGARHELFAAYGRRGQPDEWREFIAAWSKVLEGKPQEHDAWFGYAELCLFLGMEEEYLRHRRDMLAQFRDAADPSVAERVSRACLLRPWTGDELVSAVDLAGRAAAAGPGHNYYYHYLAAQGLAEYRLGHFPRAIEVLLKAFPGVQTPFPRLVLAMTLHRNGADRDAQAVLANVLRSTDWADLTSDPVNNWLAHLFRREAEELIVPHRAAFLKGEYQPRDNKERLELLEPCWFRKRYRTAAQLYTEVFAAEPKLADDLKALHRYNAARSAARAGAGQGEDAANLDDKERARWRKQAMDWLRADLALWSKRLDGGKPEERKAVRELLQLWQRDPDLAGIRDKEAVAKLPADERAACAKLWADVATLLPQVDKVK